MKHGKYHGLAIVSLGVAAASLLAPLPNLNRSTWLAKLFDLGHLPLFAVATICIWWLSERVIWRAFALATLLAVVTEVAQVFIDRSGDPWDVLRSVLGALIAVVVLQFGRRPFQWRPFAIRMAMVLALVAWPIWDCGPALIDAWWSYRSFPVISDFTSPWEPHRWYLGGAHLVRQAATEPGQTPVGRLLLSPGQDRNGAILFPIFQDWSGYRRLHCSFSFTGDPLQILISIRDGKKVVPRHRRFDLQQSFPPGQHCVVIDLKELAVESQFSPLDLTRIQSFHFVATDLSSPRAVLLEKIYLE